jgi:hypothetical protein
MLSADTVQAQAVSVLPDPLVSTAFHVVLQVSVASSTGGACTGQEEGMIAAGCDKATWCTLHYAILLLGGANSTGRANHKGPAAGQRLDPRCSTAMMLSQAADCARRLARSARMCRCHLALCAWNCCSNHSAGHDVQQGI